MCIREESEEENDNLLTTTHSTFSHTECLSRRVKRKSSSVCSLLMMASRLSWWTTVDKFSEINSEKWEWDIRHSSVRSMMNAPKKRVVRRHEAEINQNKSHLSLLRSFVIFAACLLSILRFDTCERVPSKWNEWMSPHLITNRSLSQPEECEYISQLSFRLSINLLLPFQMGFDCSRWCSFSFSSSLTRWLPLPSFRCPTLHSPPSLIENLSFNINLLSQHDLLSFGLSFLSLETTEISQTSEIWHEKLWEDIRHRNEK